jgi:hypothetical protein
VATARVAHVASCTGSTFSVAKKLSATALSQQYGGRPPKLYLPRRARGRMTRLWITRPEPALRLRPGGAARSAGRIGMNGELRDRLLVLPLTSPCLLQGPAIRAARGRPESIDLDRHNYNIDSCIKNAIHESKKGEIRVRDATA